MRQRINFQRPREEKRHITLSLHLSEEQTKNTMGITTANKAKRHIFKANINKKIRSESKSKSPPNYYQLQNRDQRFFRTNLNSNFFSERINTSVQKIIENSYASSAEKPENKKKTPVKLRISTRVLLTNEETSQRMDKKVKFRISKSKREMNESKSLTQDRKFSKEIKDHESTQFQKQQLKKFILYYKGTKRISNNEDFTDSFGNPLIQQGSSIAYRYEIVALLGIGGFGKVYKAYDHKQKQTVALKIIKFSEKLNEQAKIEIKILEKILEDPNSVKANIVKMKQSLIFRGHYCLTFELLSQNLYEYLKSNKFTPTPEKILVKFSIQILTALKFLKENKMIHCDLKPENIMLKEKSKTGIKVIDFGTSCYENQQIYTYIQSRFYRAPEIILGVKYTSAIDMWSFGLILAELVTGYPLFPGQNEEQQLLMYIEVLGNPPNSLIEAGYRRKRFYNNKFECRIVQSRDNYRLPKSLSFEKALNDCQNRQLIDLIRRCLQWQPEKRITPIDALMHEWILQNIPFEIRNKHISEVTGYQFN